MNICLFSENEIKNPLSMKDERAQHIVKVLHKKEGDTFDAGIINGKAGIAAITNIAEDCLNFDFVPFADEERAKGKPLYPLTLIIGFPRPIQLRRLLRDVAGLGVEKVILTGTELGEKSYMNSNDVKDGAAEKMLLDGTVQAASTHVPELVLVKNLWEAIDSSISVGMTHSSVISSIVEKSNIQKVALDNRRAKMSLSQWMDDCHFDKLNDQIVAAIGSERGWTEKERDFLESKGFTLCSMGSRVLRTETATTVAGSIILDRMGYLN